MQVRNVLFSQVLRYFTVSAPSGGNVYGVKLVRALQKRYGFLEGPKAVAEYNLDAGITFLHGYFEDRVVIDKCQIFKNGLVVESRAALEEWEGFVDDVVAWANDTGPIKLAPWPNAARGYYSTLEVICEGLLGTAVDRFAEATAILTEMLISYGQPSVAFQPTNIGFHADVSSLPYPKPAAFTFARREEQPYSSNIYFSAAPLKTSDHVRLLGVFEKILI